MTPASTTERVAAVATSGSDTRKVSVAQILVYDLRVQDAMSRPPITATSQATLRQIQLLMKQHKISGVPITENGELRGLISIEDIVTALDQGHINAPVTAWMSRDVCTLRDYFSLVRAVAEFDRYGFGRFPVLSADDKLVGVITRGDITTVLMHHLERRAEEAVANEAVLVAQRAPEAPGHMMLNAHVKSGDFDSAGKLSQRMRSVLRERGIDPDVRRRAAIVAYEAETNIIIHSLGGDVSVQILPDQVTITAEDQGPGIENIDLAMREGWSTAGPLARELGFGAGMGLPNMKKCSDKFEVQSTLGRGTRVYSEIILRKAEARS